MTHQRDLLLLEVAAMLLWMMTQWCIAWLIIFLDYSQYHYLQQSNYIFNHRIWLVMCCGYDIVVVMYLQLSLCHLPAFDVVDLMSRSRRCCHIV